MKKAERTCCSMTPLTLAKGILRTDPQTLKSPISVTSKRPLPPDDVHKPKPTCADGA